jgi:hypothetical protein
MKAGLAGIPALGGGSWAYREHDRIADEEAGRAAAGVGGAGAGGVPAVVPGRGRRGLAVQVGRERVAKLDASGVRAEPVVGSRL